MKELLYDFYGYNSIIFYAINEFSIKYKLQVPLLYITQIFNIENFAIYYILAAIIGYIALLNKVQKLSSYYDFMARLGISYACFGLLYALLKFTVDMPRPFCSLPIDSFITILDISKERCLSSFPSSHTGLAVLLTISFWKYSGIKIRLISLITIALVALSRITLAAHYPADIFYSLFISCFVYIISGLIYKLFENNLIKWLKHKILK